MYSVKKNIPNIFTLANLACGMLGIIEVFRGELVNACYLIWIAAGLDFLDGFTARILKASSEIGKQLDSLADLVTFGVLPAMIYFLLLQNHFESPWPYLSLIVGLFSAIRLAKFNIDDKQTTSFNGLPTPANALLASSIPLIISGSGLLRPQFSNEWILLSTMIVSSLLMVTPLTLISFKFKELSLKANLDKVGFAVVSLTLLVIIRESAIPIITVFYILLSLLLSNGKNKGD